MMVSQGRCSGLAWTLNGDPLLDVPTFMRNEILQEPYCVRLSGTVAPCIYRGWIRLRQVLYVNF